MTFFRNLAVRGSGSNECAKRCNGVTGTGATLAERIAELCRRESEQPSILGAFRGRQNNGWSKSSMSTCNDYCPGKLSDLPHSSKLISTRVSGIYLSATDCSFCCSDKPVGLDATFTLHLDLAPWFDLITANFLQGLLALSRYVDLERQTVTFHPRGRVDCIAEKAVPWHCEADNTSDHRT